jgi:exosortase/archaeosortase family protein
MTISTYLNKWHQIPAAVKHFLLKGLLMLITWKVIYLGFLLPGRIVDAPLTRTVGIITTYGLNWVTNSHNYISKSEYGREVDVDLNATSVMQQSVYYHDKKIVGVYDGCNALELFVLYAGFILCVPAASKKKWIYITGGVALIFIVNILRCIGIAYLVQYYPQHADFAHHYVFVFVVYALIIALWLAFSNNIKIKADAR